VFTLKLSEDEGYGAACARGDAALGLTGAATSGKQGDFDAGDVKEERAPLFNDAAAV